MTNDTSLESSCALLLESAKKLANLQKLNFLSKNPVKMFAKKIVQKMINYTILKALDHAISNIQNKFATF